MMASGRTPRCGCWIDFRVGVGERHDEWRVGHLFQHLRFQNAACRKAKEDIGTFDDLTERAQIGRLRITVLVGVHQFLAALIDTALKVGNPNVFARQAGLFEQAKTGKGGGACAGGDQFDLLDVFAGQFQRVAHGRRNDNRRAMLVVMEHRNVHALLQRLFDDEALRRLDVLKVDAAKGRLQRGDRVDEFCGSRSSTSMSNTSMPANFLNRTALPSITGLEAKRPIAPRPRTAVPLEITPTRFERAV
jgi:hypothetical protein